jgi:hypothetical protein
MLNRCLSVSGSPLISPTQSLTHNNYRPVTGTAQNKEAHPNPSAFYPSSFPTAYAKRVTEQEAARQWRRRRTRGPGSAADWRRDRAGRRFFLFLPTLLFSIAIAQPLLPRSRALPFSGFSPLGVIGFAVRIVHGKSLYGFASVILRYTVIEKGLSPSFNRVY